MNRELSEQDMATVIAYTEGLLPQEAQIAFELRMKNDEHLAHIVEEFVEGDAVLDELLGRSMPARRRPLLSLLLPLAAAALVIVVGYFVYRPGEGAQVGDRVAILASHAALRDFKAGSAPLRGLTPPTTDGVRRGQQEPQGGTPPLEFVDLAREYEQELAEAAFESGQVDIASNRFVIPIDVVEPVSAIVLAVSDVDPLRRLYPMDRHPTTELPIDLADQAVAARCGSGLSVLPQPRASLNQAGNSVRYLEGFTLLRGTPELRIFVGLRERELSAGELDEIDDAVAALAADRSSAEIFEAIHSTLEARDFRVSELTVREPQGQ